MSLTRCALHPMTSVVTGEESYEDYEQRVFQVFKEFIQEMACDYKLDEDQIHELFQQALVWYYDE